MSNPYIPSDINTSEIMGDPVRIDQIASRIKNEIRENIIIFLREEFELSALNLFGTGLKGLQARPNISLSTAESLLKIAISITDFNGRRLCSKADAQRMAPLAEAYPNQLQSLWILLQQNGLGIALLNVGTIMAIKARKPDILSSHCFPRHAVVTQPGGKQAIREGDYDQPIRHYFVPYPIPEWHDLDHQVATEIDDRFGNDLQTIQRIPNRYTQLNSADPNFLIWLAPDDVTKFPIDSDYGLFQRLSPWFYHQTLVKRMNVEETTHYIENRLVDFLCRAGPAGDYRTQKMVFLPKFSPEYNAQKRAALVWGAWGEVPSKEVSPYVTFLDREEPGVSKGVINSDQRIAHDAVRILFAIADHEESPPAARRLLMELAYARASMTAAQWSLSEANHLDADLKDILKNFIDAYDFENPLSKAKHPGVHLRQWANWYETHGVNTQNCPPSDTSPAGLVRSPADG